MTQKIRFGIIGTSPITDAMLAGAALYDDLQLTAVYSRTAERAAAYAVKYGAKHTFTSLEAMATAGVIDMVYIASPNLLHMQQTAVFLQNGIHVLCEKPLSALPAELEQQYAVADTNRLLLSEAIMFYFQPQTAILQNAIAQIGNIRHVRFDYAQLSSQYGAVLDGKVPNIFNPALETGALQDLGIYCVYPALYFFGMPDGITARATTLSTGADASTVALLHYPDKQVILSCCKTGQSKVASEIVGDNGTITIGSISKMENITLHLTGKDPQKLWGEEAKAVLMGREMHAFSQWIREKTPTPAYLTLKTLAMQVSVCMHAIRQHAGIIFPRDNEPPRL